jgi:hypothetical protein
VTLVTLLAVILVFCVLVFVLGILVPRLSGRVQREGNRALGVGGRQAGKAPGRLGRWFRKPFSSSRRAVDKSGSAGRRTRSKLPF